MAIARAIVKGSRILLCDEPTGSLDPDNAVMIFETLKEIARERLVVVVSHDVATASKYADRIIRLHNGEVQSDTESENVAENVAPPKAAPAVSARPKASQRVRGLFGLSLRYLKCKPARLAIMAVISVLIFTLLSVVSAISSYNRTEMTYKAMNDNNVRYYKVAQTMEGKIKRNDESVSTDAVEQDWYRSKIRWRKEDVEWFSQKFACAVDPIYELYSGMYLNVGPKPHLVRSIQDAGRNNGVVRFTADFAERYGFTLYGNAPVEADEIVLGGHAYNLFKTFGYRQQQGQITEIREPYDLIGKTVYILSNDTVGFTVTGILDTNFNGDRYDPARSFDASETDMWSTYTREFRAIDSGSVHSVIYVSDKLYKQKIQDGGEQEPTVYSVLVAAKSKREAARFAKLHDKKIARVATMHDDSYEYSINSMQYDFDNEAAAAVKRADSVFGALAKYMRYVFLGVAALTVLVVYLYFSALLGSREKDVGVLRTNGYAKGEIALPFIFEALMLSAGFILLSVITSAIAIPVFVHLFNAKYDLLFAPISFTFAQVGMITGFQLLFATLGILLPLLMLLRKKPMQIINAGK